MQDATWTQLTVLSAAQAALDSSNLGNITKLL